MLQTLMCYAKVHIKNKIIRLNFILFIYYIDLIVIFKSAKTALIYNLRHVLG
jgi:hypothetical protein